MDDESIVPKRHVTPILRADATDDNLDDVEGEGEVSGKKYKFGGLVKGPVMVCPICVLETCGHNLAKIPREASE